MKFASTILAFPNGKWDDYLANKLDSVEWTAKKLDDNDVSKVKVDTMLSLIDFDLQKYQFRNDKEQVKKCCISNVSIIKDLAENISKGYQKGITNFIYGSPLTRQDLNSNEELIRCLQEVANELTYKHIKSEIVIYIEPIKSTKHIAETYEDVVNISYQLNQSNQNENVLFKPLFDVGNEQSLLYGKTSALDVATTTDRIHVRSTDPTNRITDVDDKMIEMINQICSLNQNMTVSYEHINNDFNRSILNFCSIFKKYKTTRHYDAIIIGSGMYGLYTAKYLNSKGLKTAIVSKDNVSKEQSNIGSINNQARIHNGYHYPRSITTAQKSVEYYQDFIDDFKDATIDFNQVYAIPAYGSLTSAKQFESFCNILDVKCDNYSDSYLKTKELQGSWLTEEKAIDTNKMMSIALDRASASDFYIDEIDCIYEDNNGHWKIVLNDGGRLSTSKIINSSYAGTNEVISKIVHHKDEDLMNLKFQLCEIALFSQYKKQDIGYTFMDGPFLSIMPHTQSGLVSLSSVIYTPHQTADDINQIDYNVKSRYELMLKQASNYLSTSFINNLVYEGSKYAVKALPQNADSSDNRSIQVHQTQDHFISIVGGKLNAIYELDNILDSFLEDGVYHSTK